jgi:predicted AAA+ superfamily ATPase
LSYWTNENGNAEVDYIFEKNGEIIPLEIKANENLQAKSLKIFYEKHPEIMCYRSSLSNYRKESWITNIPLYCLSNIVSMEQ